MQSEYNDVKDGDWNSTQYAMRRFNERISVLEGHAGPIRKNSPIYMDGNQMVRGPIRQTTANPDEFITKDYLSTNEAKRFFKPFDEYSVHSTSVTEEDPEGTYVWPPYDGTPDDPESQIHVVSGNPDPAYQVTTARYQISYSLYPMDSFTVISDPSTIIPRTYHNFAMMYAVIISTFQTVNQLPIPYASWEIPDGFYCVLPGANYPGGGSIRVLSWVYGYESGGRDMVMGVMELVNDDGYVKFYGTRLGLEEELFKLQQGSNYFGFSLWIPVAQILVGG